MGAALGAVIGIFFGLPGILPGTFLGAVIGEFFVPDDLMQAGKAATMMHPGNMPKQNRPALISVAFARSMRYSASSNLTHKGIAA